MSARQSELAHYRDQIVWLDKDIASTIYIDAIADCSKNQYGLDDSAFDHVDRLDVGNEYGRAWEWLAPRVGTGNLQVVFSKSDVCRMDAAFFAANWQDIFCPSRDDVVIVPETGAWVLFYCHEEEFEFGTR